MLSIKSRPRSAAWRISSMCWAGLVPRRELRFNHLRVAENGADDVVEVMRYAAGQLTDRLHAA